MRGTILEIKNRFEETSYESFDDGWETLAEEESAPTTQFFHDNAKSILYKNSSPDVGMNYSLNAYRGCEHGCVYCRARPYHEYLGFNAGIDFESKIMVKHDAPKLLREAFDDPKWRPATVMMSGNTDCYQPVERKLKITRRLLEVFLEYRNPVSLLTKNALITRDIDLLQSLAQLKLTGTLISITSLDPRLRSALEPRTSSVDQKYKAMAALAKANIPVGVMVGPIIPGLNDNEVPNIMKRASESGATYVTHTILRLPYAVAPIFIDWLNKYAPEKSARIIARVKMIRGGKLNDPRWGTRMTGEGGYAEYMHTLVRSIAKRHGLDQPREPLATHLFKRPGELLGAGG